MFERSNLAYEVVPLLRLGVDERYNFLVALQSAHRPADDRSDNKQHCHYDDQQQRYFTDSSSLKSFPSTTLPTLYIGRGLFISLCIVLPCRGRPVSRFQAHLASHLIHHGHRGFASHDLLVQVV